MFPYGKPNIMELYMETTFRKTFETALCTNIIVRGILVQTVTCGFRLYFAIIVITFGLLWTVLDFGTAKMNIIFVLWIFMFDFVL